MNVKAKMADNYRGDPAAVVTVSGGNRPGWRLTPAEARDLAVDLQMAAVAADALMQCPCTCGHLPGVHRQTMTRPTDRRQACSPDCPCERYTAA